MITNFNSFAKHSNCNREICDNFRRDGTPMVGFIDMASFHRNLLLIARIETAVERVTTAVVLGYKHVADVSPCPPPWAPSSSTETQTCGHPSDVEGEPTRKKAVQHLVPPWLREGETIHTTHISSHGTYESLNKWSNKNPIECLK